MNAFSIRSLSLAIACVALLLTALPAGAETTRKGRSGTAFVVHKDGFLVTCAHVIRNATEVEVRIGDKTLPAKVIAQDQVRDLAVLRIKAKGLTPLVMRSEPGAMGQEVRAFGYPLTMDFGEGLKATRGTLSGYGKGDVPPLMFDVAVNHGNSGGPLVNERGEVLGVISAMIASPGVRNVGFAVAIPDVVAVLKLADREVKLLKDKKEGKPLPGPELARKVGASVGLVFAWGEDVVAIPPAPMPPPKPSPPVPPSPEEPKVAWELANDTDKEITVVIAGPENHRVVIAPGKKTTLLVPPGEYRLSIPGPDGKNLLESVEVISGNKKIYRNTFTP